MSDRWRCTPCYFDWCTTDGCNAPSECECGCTTWLSFADVDPTPTPEDDDDRDGVRIDSIKPIDGIL